MADTVRAFFERYADRYMASDAEAIADMCEVPFLAVRGGRAIHLPDRAALLEHLAGNMAAYRSSGAAAAHIADIDVEPQGDAAARVTVRWQVRDGAGATVRELRTSYQLIAAQPWRILSYVNHDLVGDGGR